MVVLSAYYIVKGPVTPADSDVDLEKTGEAELVTKEKDQNPLDVALFGPEQNKDDSDQEKGRTKRGKEEEKGKDDEGKIGGTDETAMGGDFFLSTKTERSSVDSQLIQKYTDIASNPNSSEKAVEEANAKLAELREKIEQVNTMEELIREHGFNDALVVYKDGKYDITIQAEKLTKKQVIDVLELIQGETNIPATDLTVSYHP